MTEINVNIPAASADYRISLSSGNAPQACREHLASGGFIVVDKKVAKIYGASLPLEEAYIFHALEENKTLSSAENILSWLKDRGALRDGALMALGGGVTGDTAGFAAAIYMRGIKLVQVPTTLLSMVDSSVGGKTGVNFGGIKNNIGAFHQPSSVVIDVSFLNSLSDREFLNGLAESIKIAAVCDRDFFFYIKNNKEKILRRESSAITEVIKRSCELKASVVEADEKERGKRKLLNFGHTVAHAIETDSAHSIPHGYAVAAGMALETLYALNNDLTDKETYSLIKDTLEDFGYETTYSPCNREIFLNALSKDKKAARGGISLALTGKGLTGKIVSGVKAESLSELFF